MNLVSESNLWIGMNGASLVIILIMEKTIELHAVVYIYTWIKTGREPQNVVADHIINDLDSAALYLQEDKFIKLLRYRAGMPNLILSNITVDPNWDFPSLSPII